MKLILALLSAVLAASSAVAQQAAAIEAPAGGSFYGLTPQFAVSPDGQQVVFVAGSGGIGTTLWIRPVGSGTPRAIAGTGQASYPFWSPDSKTIGFFASGKLLKVAAAGGAPVVLCDAPTGRGGTWNAEGVIVFTSGITDPLRRVSANGGQPELATTLDSPREQSHRWPQFLPDGKHVLYWAGAGSDPAQLKIVSLETKQTTTIVPADTNASYGGGYIFYGRANVLMAQAFDPVTRQKQGDPVRVAEPLSGDGGSSYASLSAASNGTILYTQGKARGFVLTWFDRTGRRLSTVGAPGEYTNVALRGACVAVSLTQGAPANRDIWVLPETCAGTRLTTHAGIDATPIWSVDGKSLIFSSPRSGMYQVYRVGADAKSPETQVFTSDLAAIATDWSRDGRFVAYTRGTAATGFDVYVVPVSGGAPVPVANGPGADDGGIFSPNGEWLAYQSNETGRSEIFVRRLASGSPQGVAVKVSNDGGTQPLWNGNGRELFYLALDGAVMSVNVSNVENAARQAPRKLFNAPVSLVIRRSYAVTAGGERFLIPVLDDSVKQTIAVAAPPARPQAAAPAAPVEFLQTFDSMTDLDAAWTKSAWANTNRAHSPDNVTIANGILELKLSATAPGEKPVCAEVASRRRDFFHGTYRASIKMSKVPGAVVGWFTYLGNPLNEIDVEFLTRDPRKAHFTLHHIRTGVDSARPLPEMPFDPSEAFHEYRFDWYADRVEYYVDGKQYATLTKEVPDMPSRLMLNHWSGNIPTWGGPAPTEDAIMLVDWVYYSPDYRAPAIPAAR
jgi:Tol biopolymer transport system component/beta-glucanase (GH16 family)